MNAKVVEMVRGATRIAVLTGAGMSAESGIPTFRGADNGLWQQYDPMTMATPEAFDRDPSLVWGWYRWRIAQVERAEPNAGHRALAELALLRPALAIITQNVDDLHERAGSQRVIHLHGSLFESRCRGCARPHPTQRMPDEAAHAPDLRVSPPACGHCGGPIRPGVVWFGETLPAHAWQAAEQAVQACDLLLVIGTSGVVHPAAGLANLAKSHGSATVEINPQPTGLSNAIDVCWRETAAVALPRLVAALPPTPPRPRR